MSVPDVAVPVGSPLADREVVEAVRCTHCGLDVPRGLVVPSATEQFCCAGCQAAFAIIHGHGLDRYYELPDRRTAPVRASDRTYEEFDHTAFQELYVRRGADGLASIDLYLEGVHCAACVWLVERVPLLVAGVARAELNVRRALAHVEWDPAAAPLSAVARALDALGYASHPFRGVKAEAMLYGVVGGGRVGAAVLLTDEHLDPPPLRRDHLGSPSPHRPLLSARRKRCRGEGPGSPGYRR